MKIRVGGLINDSIVDGPGIRYTVFFQGCKHACDGCFNKETWCFEGGKEIDTLEIIEKISKNPLLDGVTFSGGDPFYQLEGALDLALKVKKLGLNLMVYTGFTFEELLKNRKDNGVLQGFLNEIDILVDGPFIKELKDISLKFRGSSNQRIIDVKKSLEQEKVVLIDHLQNNINNVY